MLSPAGVTHGFRGKRSGKSPRPLSMRRAQESFRKAANFIRSPRRLQGRSGLEMSGNGRRGLTSRPKHLPCKLLYDERGSQLFERITELPEYYLTRRELEILRENSREIAEAANPPLSVIELGAGTATKTSTLLQAIARRQIRVKYFPVDISPSALDEAKKRVRAQFPGALVQPLVADFGQGFGFLREISGRKLVLYLGSSIGNFDWEDAIQMLTTVRQQLVAGDALLLGTDMVKGPEI